MPRRFMSRTAIAKSRGRCWARLLRRCTDFHLSLSFRPRFDADPDFDPMILPEDASGFRVRATTRVPEQRHRPKKKDQLSLALLTCDRPDPDDPGGLGAEESGTDRTGPTHDKL